MGADRPLRHTDLEPDPFLLRPVLDLPESVLNRFQQIHFIFADLNDMLFQTGHLHKTVHQKMKHPLTFFQCGQVLLPFLPDLVRLISRFCISSRVP